MTKDQFLKKYKNAEKYLFDEKGTAKELCYVIKKFLGISARLEFLKRFQPSYTETVNMYGYDEPFWLKGDKGSHDLSDLRENTFYLFKQLCLDEELYLEF